MKTFQVGLDEKLVRSVDRAVEKLYTTRSAFTRDALRDALKRISVTKRERQHRKGYKAHPVDEAEFNVWEEEQAWGDA